MDEENELQLLEQLSRSGDAPPADNVVFATIGEQDELGELSKPAETPITPEEATGAVTRGAVSEALTAGTGIAGGYAGFKAGVPLAAAAAPVLGPFASAIPFITGATGFGLGLYSGETLANSLIDAPDNEALAPYTAAGETLGGTIAFAPLAFGIPANLGTRIGPYISSIGEFARKYPKSFVAGELLSGAGAATGAFTAESLDPGDPLTRFGAEVTLGGPLNPFRLVPTLTSKGGELLKTAWTMRNAQGRQAFAESRTQQNMDAATARLVKILEENGEDIPALIKALEEPLPGAPDVTYPAGGTGRATGPTAAQKTGSLTLAQLEAALSTLDPKFAPELTEQGRQALLAFSKVTEKLREAGSPEALRTAARLRQDFFNSALDGRLNRAMINAGDRVSKITSDSPQARTEIGRIIREEIERAEENARAAERLYWQAAERQAVTPTGTIRVSELTPSTKEMNDAYNKAATTLLSDLRDIRPINFNDPRQVSRVTGQQAKSFGQYLKEETGGIAINSEFLARDLNSKTRPGLFVVDSPINRRTGGMDSLREAAFKGGYFPNKADYNEITDDEIYDLLVEDTFSGRVWQGPVREALFDYQQNQNFLDRMDARGFRPDMTEEQIANRMRALDEQARADGSEDLFVPLAKQRRVTRTIQKPNVLAPQNVVDTYLERVSQIGPAFINDMVPANVRKMMEDFGVTQQVLDRYRLGRESQQFIETGRVDPRFRPKPGTIKEVRAADLINYRSNLLSLAREARAKGELAQANFYSFMAESMLNDLSTLPGEAYDNARSFSRALNDTFTRTFANDLLATTKTGANRFPVETLVNDAFGAGSDRTALRMREIETATGFLRNQLDDAARLGGLAPEDQAKLEDFAKLSTEGVASIQDAQNRVLRLLASKATFVDPKTNVLRVNTRQLNKFVNDYKPLLDQMGITGDLQNAAQAENLLAAVIKQNSRLNKDVRNQMAFAKILGVESPTTAIANALSPSNKYPIRSMRQLANFARRAGPEAVEGLKAAIYDYAFTKASGGTPMLNPEAFANTFFKKYATDQPELASILRTAGIFTPEELKNIRTLTNQMVRVEDAMKNRVALEGVLQGADVVGELAMRVAGSQIGTAASGGGPGALIAASAGSKAVRQIFDKMPMMMVRKLIQQAAQDPNLMAQLLKRNMSEREKFRLARSLHSYLIASGLNYATYEPPPEEQQTRVAPGAPGSAASDLQNLQNVYDALRGNKPQPPAPTTRGMPGMPSGAPPAGGPPAGGGAPPTTQSRMMLQQLFPFDPITGAAAVQSGMPPMAG